MDRRQQFDDNICISSQWLNYIQEYQLKILILTSVLAQNNLAYRGNLKTMCQWLGVSSCTRNNAAIKAALNNLQKNGYIFYKVQGRIHHVSISNKGMKDKRVYKVRKLWIQAFKQYNKDENGKKINKDFSVDWIKILKVFIWLYYKHDDVFTLEQLSKLLNMSKDTIRKSITAIMQCDLKGIGQCKDKRIIKQHYLDNSKKLYWRTIGTQISFGLQFKK